MVDTNTRANAHSCGTDLVVDIDDAVMPGDCYGRVEMISRLSF